MGSVELSTPAWQTLVSDAFSDILVNVIIFYCVFERIDFTGGNKIYNVFRGRYNQIWECVADPSRFNASGSEIVSVTGEVVVYIPIMNCECSKIFGYKRVLYLVMKNQTMVFVQVSYFQQLLFFE